jgi:hypothetical protein
VQSAPRGAGRGFDLRVDLNLSGNRTEKTLKKRISVFPTGTKWNIGNTGPNWSCRSGVGKFTRPPPSSQRVF